MGFSINGITSDNKHPKVLNLYSEICFWTKTQIMLIHFEKFCHRSHFMVNDKLRNVCHGKCFAMESFAWSCHVGCHFQWVMKRLSWFSYTKETLSWLRSVRSRNRLNFKNAKQNTDGEIHCKTDRKSLQTKVRLIYIKCLSWKVYLSMQNRIKSLIQLGIVRKKINAAYC